jgi:G:T-mismatch repair DNA endonuclease (very short patch repair protein)
MFNCAGCNKEFEKSTQIKGHNSRCLPYKALVMLERNTILTKKILYDLYVIKKLSALEISRTLNLKYNDNAGTIIHLLKSFNIQTRNIKETSNLENVRKKCEQTCISKYGDTNVLGKNSYKFKERNETVLNRYGKSNVFAVDSVKDTIKETMVERYGVEYPVHVPGRKHNNGQRSKIHIKVESLLEQLDIDYVSENTLNLFEKDGYSPRPDITIEGLKIVIEVNGDYWHANPFKYKENDIIAKWGGDVLVKDIWKNDKKRKEQIESFGWTVITLWESDINNNLNKEELWKILELNQ